MPQETSGDDLQIPISVEAHETERFKTAFYRFLELRMVRLPHDGEAPQIHVVAGAASISGAEGVGGFDLAREFATYWTNNARSSSPGRDPITRQPRASWAEGERTA